LPFLSPIDFFDRLYDILRYFTITKFESNLGKKIFTGNYFMIIPMDTWAEKNMGLFDCAGKAWFSADPFIFSTIFIIRNTMGNKIRGQKFPQGN
jgi:hypothetical protein